MDWIDTPTNAATPAAIKKKVEQITPQRISEITSELPDMGEASAQAVTPPHNPFVKRPLAGVVQPVLPIEPRRSDGSMETSMETITKSKAMTEALTLSKRYAEGGEGAILLRGETGVGKSHIAEQIAKWTGRKGPFVTVCCAAIPSNLIESQLFGHMRGSFSGATSNFAGAFKQADGGVIFLDEVGELPLDMQQKLLRVTQDGTFRPIGAGADVRVDVRIVSATNKNLEAEVKAGRFREDLRFRLSALPVTIPPLRERRGEIAGLVAEKVARRNLVLGEGVLEVFEFAHWPGNIRELLNTVERAALAGWTAKDAARELASSLAASPGAGRMGRLAKARELSARGWWSATELALACGASTATAKRDCAEWVDVGELVARGEGPARRYIGSDQLAHEPIEPIRLEQKTEGEVAK